MVKIGKAHGKARVSVGSRGRYAAEVSPNPVGEGTWSPLPGTGDTRRRRRARRSARGRWFG
ncbi:MAG: hypothetical protein QM820_39440 [Minicystis sp.]